MSFLKKKKFYPSQNVKAVTHWPSKKSKIFTWRIHWQRHSFVTPTVRPDVSLGGEGGAGVVSASVVLTRSSTS